MNENTEFSETPALIVRFFVQKVLKTDSEFWLIVGKFIGNKTNIVVLVGSITDVGIINIALGGDSLSISSNINDKSLVIPRINIVHLKVNSNLGVLGKISEGLRNLGGSENIEPANQLLSTTLRNLLRIVPIEIPSLNLVFVEFVVHKFFGYDSAVACAHFCR